MMRWDTEMVGCWLERRYEKMERWNGGMMRWDGGRVGW